MLKETFVNYEFIDITGEIHNAWQAFADEKGLQSPECQSLIRAFKTAVKSTKHGFNCEVEYPQPESYPHYMYVKPIRKSTHGKEFYWKILMLESSWKIVR